MGSKEPEIKMRISYPHATYQAVICLQKVKSSLLQKFVLQENVSYPIRRLQQILNKI